MIEFMTVQLGKWIQERTTTVTLGSSFPCPGAFGDYRYLPASKRDEARADGRDSDFFAASAELMEVLKT